MKNDVFNKLRRKCWTFVGRRGGKNHRDGKRAMRAREKNWTENQEFKEERRFNEIEVDNVEES